MELVTDATVVKYVKVSARACPKSQEVLAGSGKSVLFSSSESKLSLAGELMRQSDGGRLSFTLCIACSQLSAKEGR